MGVVGSRAHFPRPILSWDLGAGRPGLPEQGLVPFPHLREEAIQRCHPQSAGATTWASHSHTFLDSVQCPDERAWGTEPALGSCGN